MLCENTFPAAYGLFGSSNESSSNQSNNQSSNQSSNSDGMFSSFFSSDKKNEPTPEVMSSNSFDSMKDIDLDKELNSINLDSGSSGMSGPGLPNLDYANWFTKNLE